MSESRVRENRTHGSMRRREAPTRQSATPRGAGRASRRPYPGAATERKRAPLRSGDSDSAPRNVSAMIQAAAPPSAAGPRAIAVRQQQHLGQQAALEGGAGAT